MKHVKKIIFSSIFSLLVVTGVALSQFFPDIIVTSPNGIWTDTRAYSTIDAAITAIGSNERDIYIVREEATTALVIPSNARLHFFATGSIANSGQLTINTRNISAGYYQIFTGSGDIDFAQGSIIKSSWFLDIDTALTLISDDFITLNITKQETLHTSAILGNGVFLKWDSYLMLGAASGITLSNIGQVEAGKYQIFSGAGSFRFKDGTILDLSWFANLRSALSHISTSNITLVNSLPRTVDFSSVIPTNITLDIKRGGIFTVNNGIILTINGNLIAGPYQIFLPLGSVILSSIEARPEWFYSGSGTYTAAFHATISSFGTRPGTIKLMPKTYVVPALVVDARVTIEGAGGYLEDETATSYGTILEISGATGIRMETQTARLKNLIVKGAAANTAYGVWMLANATVLDNVSVMSMGGVGIKIGDPINSVNCNSWRLYNVISRANTSHGVVIDDSDPGGGPDANAGAAFGLNCQNNGGDGLRIDNAQINSFHGLKTEGNTGYGVRVMENAQNACFFNPHSEGNTAGEFIFEASSKNNMLIGAYNFSPTDNGTNTQIRGTGGTSGNLAMFAKALLLNTYTNRYSQALTNAFGVEGALPGMFLYESDGDLNEKLWALFINGGVLRLRALKDDQSAYEDVIAITRVAQAISALSIPNGLLLVTDGIGVGNSSTTAPDVTGTTKSKKIQVFDATGAGIGYLQVYDGPGS